MITERTLEIIEEVGRIPVSQIDKLKDFIMGLERIGFNCYLSDSTDELIIEMGDKEND